MSAVPPEATAAAEAVWQDYYGIKEPLPEVMALCLAAAAPFIAAASHLAEPRVPHARRRP